MIDLTGRSPGLLYGIGASSTGYPWIYGNYVNSNFRADALAIEILKGVTCDEIAAAWLLVEPNGPVSISPSILSNFGLNIDKDYQKLGSVLTTWSLGGFSVIHDQWVFKPIRDPQDASNKCLNAKAERDGTITTKNPL
jgi:hypothetical protein